MRWFILLGLLPAAAVGLYSIGKRVWRRDVRQIRLQHAGTLFRMQRERLEAQFVAQQLPAPDGTAVAWPDASWHDEVVWARHRRSQRLVALVGVDFPPPALAAATSAGCPHATVLFLFAKEHWQTTRTWFDQLKPHQVLLTQRHYIPIISPPSLGQAVRDI